MIKVLDNGYLKLINSWGSDQEIIEAARMSTDKGFLGWGTDEKPGDEKLLKYLWEHKHASPFEQAGLTFEVQAPIMVFREWHRHRTQCLAGDVALIFERPCDNKSYRKLIKDVVKSWNDPAQKPKIQQMLLRSPNGPVNITDAWFSGTKQVYKLKTKYGTVITSANHMFKTPEGSALLLESPKYVMGMVQKGSNIKRTPPILDYSKEEWRKIDENYDVSNLGRVRSWTNVGRNPKRLNQPIIKAQTINASNRLIVSINRRTFQVSRLVAKAFIGELNSDIFVCHKDDNYLNNQVDNLYFGNAKDNSDDQLKNGGRKHLHEEEIKVEYITKVGEEDTFDISVTGNHWFTAENLIVHNSYNEFSARYSVMPNLHYLPTLERIKEISSTNKQAQGVNPLADDESIEEWLKEGEAIQQMIYEHYKRGISLGIAKEVARFNTPVSRYSKMRASGNLRNWLAFDTLRNDRNAQWEIRQYAIKIGEIIQQVFPRTWKVYKP